METKHHFWYSQKYEEFGQFRNFALIKGKRVRYSVCSDTKDSGLKWETKHIWDMESFVGGKTYETS
jgi:hypothetical protein